VGRTETGKRGGHSKLTAHDRVDLLQPCPALSSLMLTDEEAADIRRKLEED
jgi:hypothetical protein